MDGLCYISLNTHTRTHTHTHAHAYKYSLVSDLKLAVPLTCGHAHTSLTYAYTDRAADFSLGFSEKKKKVI
jgi:hypothetical protein